MTGLKDFRSRLVGLTGAAFLQRRNELIGARLEALTLQEFRDSRDPYGKVWKPVQRLSKRLRRGFSGPRRRGTPLVKTGALRASHVSSGSATGARVGFADSVAIFPQKGTVHMEKRQILPEASTGGLPRAWQVEIGRVVSAATRAQVLGAAS